MNKISQNKLRITKVVLLVFILCGFKDVFSFITPNKVLSAGNKISSLQINNPYDFSKSLRILMQTHCHTTQSDGQDTPQQLIEKYYNLGYKALAITDHDRITWPWPINPDQMVPVMGNELTGTNWHMGSLFNDYLRGNGNNAQIWINEINKRNGLAVICHPGRWGKTCNDVKSLVGYQGIEIYNRKTEVVYNISSVKDLSLWDCLLSSGRQVWGLAVDDYHGGEENIDWGKIIVLANDYTEQEIKNNLKSGNFYAVVGKNNNLAFQNISVNNLTLQVTTNISADIKFIGNNGTTLKLASNTTQADYVINGQEKYIRIEASCPQGTIYSNPLSLNRIHPSGTLIQVKSPYSPSEPAVYRIDGNQKRLIPDPYVYSSQFSWNKIIAVSTFERDSYSSGTLWPFRDGELVKEQSNPTVYVFENGQKRGITSANIFNAYRYNWNNIIVVPSGQLSLFSTGPNLSSYSPATYPSGSLLKADNHPAIYRIENGKKRLIPDPYVYSSQFSWNKYITVPASVLTYYPEGEKWPFRDGELVKEQGRPEVYVFENGKKRWITDPTTFNAYGYSWSNVIIVPNNGLNQFPTGDPLSI